MEEQIEPKTQSSAASGQIPQEIMNYLTLLIQESKADILPGQIQAKIMMDLYKRLNDYLLININNALQDEKKNEFEDLLENNAEQAKINDFVKANCDYGTVVKSTLDEFRKDYLKTQ